MVESYIEALKEQVERYDRVDGIKYLINIVFVSDGDEREAALKLLKERGVQLTVKMGDNITVIPWDKVKKING